MRRVHHIRHVHKYETLGSVFKVLLIGLQIPSSRLDIFFILVVIFGSQFQRLLKNRFCFLFFAKKQG